MNDEWFADEDAVRKNVGLLCKPLTEATCDSRDVSVLTIFNTIITGCLYIG